MPKRKPNPDQAADWQAAARMSEQFHGRPARTIREIEQTVPAVVTLAELGRLIELHVLTADGRAHALTFGRGARLATNPAGNQLYIIGGDQEPNLKALGVAGNRDFVLIGEAWKVVYFTSKAFHNFEPAEYIHEFGENRGGERPALGYSTKDRRLFLIGGTYRVKPEGIVN